MKWETDMACNCETCQSEDSADWCCTYWPAERDTLAAAPAGENRADADSHARHVAAMEEMAEALAERAALATFAEGES